jgi:homoserine dehydrogenase
LAQARSEDAEILSVEGVLNGTVNFVLEGLARGLDLTDALRAARNAGLAEEDASLDLSGTDAAAKLRLIAQEAFGAQFDDRDFHIEALDDAVARRAVTLQLRQISRVVSRNGRLTAEIVYEPAHHTHFAELGGDRNGVLIRAHDGRQWRARGRGAGRWPTTESVLADLADLANELS